MNVNDIDVKDIDPAPVQLRRLDISIAEEMAKSVKQSGFLQPILVRPKGNRYEVVFGSHRLEVAKYLGHKTIPAVVKTLNDDDAILLSIAENSQRNAHLDPTTEGQVFDELCEKGWTEEKIAKTLGKSDLYIRKRLSVYRDLHPKLLNRVSHRKLPLDQAYAIAQHPMNEQLNVAKEFQEKRKALSQTQPHHDFRCLQCPLHCPRRTK